MPPRPLRGEWRGIADARASRSCHRVATLCQSAVAKLSRAVGEWFCLRSFPQACARSADALTRTCTIVASFLPFPLQRVACALVVIAACSSPCVQLDFGIRRGVHLGLPWPGRPRLKLRPTRGRLHRALDPREEWQRQKA
jgi:hypothetical protein